ncbi:MAG TPA: cyclase family protein [Clostridiaceae bacterium]|nr:cyclase family protein [Clostridiaceae bacterium]
MILDITGVIEEGMWNYDYPYPEINIKPLPKVDWVDGEVFSEIFEGLHSQTGTYLETPAHYFGNNNSYLLIDVPVEKLVSIDCTVLQVADYNIEDLNNRPAITLEDLLTCEGAEEIEEGNAIVVGTGWGKYWKHKDYLNLSPFFKREAIEWIISKKPLLLGSDLARWENLEKPEGFFPAFYKADILMAGPFINIEKIEKTKCKLTILPLKVVRTSCAPCRAIVEY